MLGVSSKPGYKQWVRNSFWVGSAFYYRSSKQIIIITFFKKDYLNFNCQLENRSSRSSTSSCTALYISDVMDTIVTGLCRPLQIWWHWSISHFIGLDSIFCHWSYVIIFHHLLNSWWLLMYEALSHLLTFNLVTPPRILHYLTLKHLEYTFFFGTLAMGAWT